MVDCTWRSRGPLHAVCCGGMICGNACGCMLLACDASPTSTHRQPSPCHARSLQTHNIENITV